MFACVQSKPLFSPRYQRHEPEKTVLYKVVSNNWNTFLADAERDTEGYGLPKYIKKEFEAYLQCGILQYGFLRVHCEACKEERLVAFSCKKRGFCPSCGGRRMSETAARLVDFVFPRVPVRQWVLSLPIPMRYWLSSNPKLVTSVLEILMRSLRSFYRKRAIREGRKNGETGAITFIQRFGSALNLNVHFHILFLDGVFCPSPESEKPVFWASNPPTDFDIKELAETIFLRVRRHLKRKGYLKDEDEVSGEGEDPLSRQSPLLAACVAASVQNKTALGERAGQYVRKLGVHPLEAQVTGYKSAAFKGFSLHGGVAVGVQERDKLERLIRYVARPSVALERMDITDSGQVIYRLKKTFTDGTTHVLFSQMELVEKLIALIPRPRVHIVRYHGILAPHAAARSQVVPKPELKATKVESEVEEAGSKAKRMSWARLLKRVFDFDVTVCFSCQGAVKIIAAILERAVIIKILAHVKLPIEPPIISDARAPPQASLFYAKLPHSGPGRQKKPSLSYDQASLNQ